MANHKAPRQYCRKLVRCGYQVKPARTIPCRNVKGDLVMVEIFGCRLPRSNACGYRGVFK
jgi:hypothetical protein